MARAKRTSAARKTAGIKGKRITAKQKVARVKNIAIARKHRGKGRSKKLNPNNKVDRNFMIAAFKAGIVKIR